MAHGDCMTCAGCGVGFTGRKRKYCAKECRLRHIAPGRMAPIQRECLGCGATFLATRDKHRHCTKICYMRARNVQPKKHMSAGCGWCKRTYHPKVADRNKFCSRECAFEMLHHLKAERAILKRIQRNWRKKLIRECIHCSREFRPLTTEGYCRDECRGECRGEKARKALATNTRNHIAKTKPRDCIGCGLSFIPVYGDKRRAFCSVMCRRRYANRTSSSNHRKRARHYGCYYEPVNLKKILERDGYKCGICGEMTEPDSVLYSPRYPSVDHIIPLSKGGPHRPANLQCACFMCNSIKGAA